MKEKLIAKLEEWFKDFPYIKDTEERKVLVKGLLEKHNTVKVPYIECIANTITFHLIFINKRVEFVGSISYDEEWHVDDTIVYANHNKTLVLY